MPPSHFAPPPVFPAATGTFFQAGTNPPRAQHAFGLKGLSMSRQVIDRPVATEQTATEFRRDVQKVFNPAWQAGAPDLELRAQFTARPARSWAEAAAETGFLLERFSRTAEGQEERMQKLIRRALGDLERLVSRDALKR
jgi:hypothetical protein